MHIDVVALVLALALIGWLLYVDIVVPWIRRPRFLRSSWSWLGWECHICGRVRPDEKIGVFSRDSSAAYNLDPGMVEENVRYCKDDPACAASARTFSFTPAGRKDPA